MDSEIKAGDWVIVSSVEDGDVACLWVERISQEPDERPMAHLSDCTTWLADTGEPLSRAWKGHRIRPVTEGYLRNKIRERVDKLLAGDMSDATLAEVYSALLRVTTEER